jgi:2-hydroxy-3-oxopropionate reductase
VNGRTATAPHPPSAPIGFLGLGTMGLPMAANLVAADFDVLAWNRGAAARERAADAGIALAGTPRDVAQACDAVFTMLPDLPQVREVLAGPDGLLASARPGATVVVMGTVSPLEVAALAADLADHGVTLLDAPVSGGEKGAVAASLSIMVGGDAEAFERLRPAFEAMGRLVRRLGPAGSGSIAKACNQLVVAATLGGLCEAVLLAERAGLDPAAVLEVLGGGLAASEVLEQKRDQLVRGDFAGRGPARYLLKDLRFALAAAQAHEARLPITSRMHELYQTLVDQGLGDLDNSALLAVLRGLHRSEPSDQ